MIIRNGLPADFPRLQEIEVDAGGPFRAFGMADIADMPPPTTEQLRSYLGRCWVAEADIVAAYLLADAVGGCAHIAQVSLDQRFRGQRTGQRLIDHVEQWAKANDLAALTLTTFRDIPWNAPYYERIGFRVVEPTPALAELVEHEASIGLDPDTRVCMRREF
ncbi:Histone acetyltransferase HPA2 and related acetyltransferases [Alloactinosynnema sp. L-07]|uniref:GNAT family N-acetyltransferase n=1 Tax=Alloactinosynnema sp. L-07 TaxID=1653480 RepID=UPI00065EF896|nr:GNAT family N-acetyltransferase [Alloactinosynnema sp. L-07]CRK59955.1 Histone acetyltransferase HPA2 and related acetyltransferases [Alloactinosynnema sp. L-07]